MVWKRREYRKMWILTFLLSAFGWWWLWSCFSCLDMSGLPILPTYRSTNVSHRLPHLPAIAAVSHRRTLYHPCNQQQVWYSDIASYLICYHSVIRLELVRGWPPLQSPFWLVNQTHSFRLALAGELDLFRWDALTCHWQNAPLRFTQSSYRTALL